MDGEDAACYSLIMPEANVIQACPACGAAVPAGAAACPGCGYSIRRRIQQKSGSKGSALFVGKLLGAIHLLGIFFVVGLFIMLNIRLRAAAAYQDSLRIAQNSVEVKNILGDDIKAGSFPYGFSFPTGAANFAQWSVKLTGSRGTGHLYGVANQVAGSWEYFRLVVASDKDGRKIDLTPAPQKLRLNPVPAKKVYLIPIGLASDESLDWAPAYFKAKLGIDLAVLPAVPFKTDLVDSKRQRLDADKTVEYLIHSHPELAGDPFAVLVGVTSQDFFIGSLDLRYAENFRRDDRFGLVSSARLRPPSLLDKLNPEWRTSRLEKLLAKNLVMLYFDLPLSSDPTSLLSAGVLGGTQIDEMTGNIGGARGGWHCLLETADPSVTIYDVPGKPPLWRRALIFHPVPDTNVQRFTVDLGNGLLVQEKSDFVFEDDAPLEFTRVYTTFDEVSRAFGVGATHTLEMGLVGEMSSHIELVNVNGSRIHFDYVQPRGEQPYQIYRSDRYSFAFPELKFSGNVWELRRFDGWTFYFPFRPDWPEAHVTVLGWMTDPQGRKYEMERGKAGDLVSVRPPSGKWLHFEYDSEHRIREITSSQGRTVRYGYDLKGHLIRVEDSEGHIDSYSYNDRSEMLTAAHGNDPPFLKNEYFLDNDVKGQLMADGKKFEYFYFREARNTVQNVEIVDPNLLVTFIQYGPYGYIESLPAARPY